MPTGCFVTFEGIYAEQTRSTLRLLGLSLISLSLIFAVLDTKYRSVTLTMIIMCNAPGNEILHPVAVVIFGGLVSATFLDSLLTPMLFLRFGRASLERLVSQIQARRVVESY